MEEALILCLRLSPTEATVLAAVARGRRRVREIAEATGMSEKAVYTALERLVKAGLVRIAGREKTPYGGRPVNIYEVDAEHLRDKLRDCLDKIERALRTLG